MAAKSWLEIHAPGEDLQDAWEVFHENSKLTRFDTPPSDAQSAAWAVQVSETLAYEEYPQVPLPELLEPLALPLSEAFQARATPTRLERKRLSLDELATLLFCAYGVNRDAEASGFRRPLRTAPSAGALYPLELFLHAWSVEGLSPGLYHFNPVENELRRIRDGDQTPQIASALVHKQLALEASLMIFIGAIFERTTVKYGERGYRFVLLEAGHVAQNMSLAAVGLGLGCIPIGGYLDRPIDALIGFDGLLGSTIYMAGIGGLPGRGRPLGRTD